MSCRRCGGKLFHTCGPVAMKLWSPKLLCVRRMKHVLTAAERSGRHQCPSQVGCRQLCMSQVKVTTESLKLPNLACISFVAFVCNKKRCTAHECRVEYVDGNVEVQDEIACCFRPRPDNRWPPVKQLCKQNTAALEVALQCTQQIVSHFSKISTMRKRHRKSPPSFYSLFFTFSTNLRN